MQTDNTVSQNSNVLLEAAKNYGTKETASSKMVDWIKIQSFADGARWQKEQYAELIHSHSELKKSLEQLLSSYRADFQMIAHAPLNKTESVKRGESAIEKANSIINSIK